MEWVTVGISKPLIERIKRIMHALGYPSYTAFIAEAVRIHVERKEWEFDRIAEERETGRKVLGRDEGDL